jgi:hypothetical protein
MLLVLEPSQNLINIEQHHCFFLNCSKFAASASGIHSKVRSGSKSYFKGFFNFQHFFLHLPPHRFLCIGGCWGQTQDSANSALAIRRTYHSARCHPQILQGSTSRKTTVPPFMWGRNETISGMGERREGGGGGYFEFIA